MSLPLCRPEKAKSDVGLSAALFVTWALCTETDNSPPGRLPASACAVCQIVLGVVLRRLWLRPWINLRAPLSPSQSRLDKFMLPSLLFDPFAADKSAAQPQVEDHGAAALDWQNSADLPNFEVPVFNTEFRLDTSVFSNGSKKSQPGPEFREATGASSWAGTPARGGSI